jgi:hypothetical protein
MLAIKFYTFVDGKTAAGLITAARLNGNIDNLITVLNGEIEDDNIKTGAKIMVSNRSYTGTSKITGTWQFNVVPQVPAASILDASLSSNIPLKNAANVFTAKQHLNAGLDLNSTEAFNFVAEQVATLPVHASADAGRIVYCTADNYMYCGNASTWVRLDYIGDYTGGAIRNFSDAGIVDDNDSYKLWFKTEGGTPTIKIAICGRPFPKRYYTELGQHTHAFTGSSHVHTGNAGTHNHSILVGSHTHSGDFGTASHTHGINGVSGSALTTHLHTLSETTSSSDNYHRHSVYACPGGGGYPGQDTTYAAAHTHTVTGNVTATDLAHTHNISVTSGSPSGSSSVSSTDLGYASCSSESSSISINSTTADGSNANTGLNGGTLGTTVKLYAYHLVVKIDGTDVSNDIKSAKSWSHIGDGTGTHAFHASGTGELDASSWVTYSPGYHTLEILEPNTGYGSSLMVFVETT